MNERKIHMPLLKYRSKEQWKEIKENARSAHQKRAGIGNIHEAVRKAFKKGELPDPYDKFNENFGDKYEAELHASIGKKMTEEGKNVLQIDVAGSGVQQPVNMQEGFTGENTIKDGEFEYDIKKFRTLERKKVGWWNRLFSFLPFVWSEEKIQRYNEFLNKYGRKETPDRRTSDPSETFRAQETESFGKKQIQETKTSPRNQTQTIIREDGHAMPEKEHFKTGAEKIFAGRYGTTPKNENLKEKELIHMKEKTDTAEDGTELLRRRYAMAGPQGGIFGTKLGAGVSNKGDYSINNLSNYILEAGKEYLEQIFNNWKTEDDAKSHPINISLRGHSRGAVAVSHGAMKLKYWLNKYYPQYEPYVTFNLIQNDPVPGYGSDHGLKQKINLQNETRADLKKEMEKREMKELGDSVNSTVVYSLHTQYPVFFSPQSVDGAKRIILTAGTHSVNTDHVDRSQSDKAHRQPYMDMETGEVYRSSGLSELPEGIYIADENYRLVRIPNFEIAKDILGNVLEKAGGQGERHKRIKEVIKNWYEARTTGKKSSEQGREKDPGFAAKRDKLNKEDIKKSIGTGNMRQRSNTTERARLKSNEDKQKKK